MEAIDARFVSFEKAFASTLMRKLSSMMFDKGRYVREHIMEIRDITANRDV